MLRYLCRHCARAYDADLARWRCDCGGPLDLPARSGLAPDDVDRDEPSLWRYHRALAIAPPRPNGAETAPGQAYFAEGLTPLAHRHWAGADVAFKLDYLFPSGSFKDRGSALMVNGLAALGATHLHEDSSGNGGASVACYAAAAGLDATIYVPAHASPGKLVQVEAYGAELVRVPGSRQDTADAAAGAVAADGPDHDEAGVPGTRCYASHNWQPLFVEGVKTLGYELWEQHGWSAPDVVVAPIGYGSTVLGVHRAFAELLRRGSVQRLPRIYACQSAAVPSFHRAWLARDPEAAALDPADVRPTLAEGVASTRPVRVREVLTALEETGGGTVAVEEDEIRSALLDVARLGLYVEPTSAVAPAALRKLVAAGAVDRDEGVVVVLTGSGLKATDAIGALRKRP